ncbi:MAG: replicative DNA helicase [Candidatus Absconditabacteria bacterium]
MVDIDAMRLPPHSSEAEKAVLSSVFIDNEVIYVLDGFSLNHLDFYLKEHQIIFEAMKDIWSSRKTIDVVTVADKIKKMGELDNIGGIEYLYEISAFIFTAANAQQHGKIVKEKSILRTILKSAQKMIGDVYAEKDFTDIIDSIEKKVFELTQYTSQDSMQHIKNILDERSTYFMEIVDNPGIVDQNKVLSKYNKIDEMLSGFKPGELIILAARPSMGKTAFALNLALNGAVSQKKSIAIFSLEMGSDQIVDRILSSVSSIPMFKITKGLLDDQDFMSIGDAMEKLGDTNIYIDDKGGASVNELKSKLRKLIIEKGGIDMVIIDYLQLMNGGGRFAGNRVQEITEISRGLKELARELKLPIIALSQMSRGVEARPDKRPQLSDLRDSGAIEQDADAVMMLYRDDYYDAETDKKDKNGNPYTEVFIRKNRNGPTGDAELVFKKDSMIFFDITNEYQD